MPLEELDCEMRFLLALVDFGPFLTCVGKRLSTTTHSPKFLFPWSRLFPILLCSASLVSSQRRSLQFLVLHPLPGRSEVCGSSLLGGMLAWNGDRALVFAEGGHAAKTSDLSFL